MGYESIPNFAILLRGLLDHVVVLRLFPLPPNHDGKIREFARLAEFLHPHKDVFRKHVIGLLSRYADALTGGIHPAVKVAMTPAVYALIDLCSSYELEQLKGTMSPEGKMLFRPIFQNYQK